MVDKKQQVFEIMEVESRADNIYLVRGLCYKHIKVGDVLYTNDPNAASEYLSFKATDIVTYHGHVPQLPAGYTGELHLEGSNGDSLQKVSHLLL